MQKYIKFAALLFVSNIYNGKCAILYNFYSKFGSNMIKSKDLYIVLGLYSIWILETVELIKSLHKLFELSLNIKNNHKRCDRLCDSRNN